MRTIVSLLLAVLVAACDSGVDRRLAIDLNGIATYYPGRQVECSRVDRCGDVLAEVDAWVELHARPARTDHLVTLHEPATVEGPAVITRSGGSTWVAVVTFSDGSRAAFIVGCGMGIAIELCFSDDGNGHYHTNAED